MKLLQVDTLAEAREKLEKVWKDRRMETEDIPLETAHGRVLAEDIRAGEDIPGFRRSSVDGYAVCAKDTAGATESIPVFLEIVEEVSIGHAAGKRIENGQCAYVPTGGMIPEGADAMVMVEYCELFDENHAALYQSVPHGKFVVEPGEDVKAGSFLLSRGTVLGPAQIGALAAAGVSSVPVFVPWKVGILSTGDELVSVDETPGPGQVRDINTWALRAFAARSGMEVVVTRTLADDEGLLEAAVSDAMKSCDVVFTSGGSSQGKKDMTEEILSRVSGGNVFTHGLALKPGKPTILGYDRETGTLLGGLPGHPVAALTVFKLLFIWLWKRQTGQREDFGIMARMKSNLASAPGKTTCLLVRLSRTEEGFAAEPILGKSGLITTMAEADGYVMIDMNREGLKAGELVEVHRLG